MKRSMLSFLFVFYSHFTLSQTPEEIWSVTYPEPDTNFIHIQKMLCDSEGNTYLTGFINRAGKEDYLTIKYNNNGIKLWTATYNSSYDSTDRATDIAVDESGNVYVTGRSIDGGSPNDYLTIKYNSEGVEQWTARFNGSGPYEKFSFRYIALDELGNIYITGTNWGNNIQVWNFVTVKYNNNGTMLWSVHYDVGGSGNTEVPIAIQCDNSGNVIVTGWGLYDYTTVKYNASGVQLWTAEEIINTGEPKGLEIDNSDNVYICGSDSGGNGGFRVIKYNPSGVKLWNVIHLSPGIPSDLTIHSSGYLYVTGSTGSFLTPYATLLKLSSANGSLIWSANYNIPFSSGEYLSTDASGNIYVAANLFNISYNEFSSSLIKYNSSGTKIWNYDYYGTTEDLNPAASVCTDGFGNIYLLSRNEIQENLFTIDEDYTILKFNSGGNQQWNSTPGFDSFNNLSEFNIDNEGNIYATGSVKRIGTNYDILTAKYDSSGSVLWYTFYNGPIDSTDSPSGIFIDDNYNVYVTGQSQGSGTDYDYVIIKYNSSGAEQWTARYNGPPSSIDEAQKVLVDDIGNVYVTGNSLNTDGNFDIATLKYNGFGQLQWIKRYNGTSNGSDFVCGLEMDAAGDIYIGGTSDSIGTLYDYIILKYSSAGNLLWTKRYNGTANDGDQAKAMTIDNSGNIYITGWSVGTGTNLDFATVKYTSNGIELWAARWDDPANQFEEANAIAVDKNYNVFVAGFSPGAGTGEDFTTVKYNSAGNQQWVSHFNGQGSSPDIGMFITLDGYNDSYVYGQSNSNAAFIKYNSDGILQSQTIYNPFPSTFTPSGICLDNLGNIYAGGTASSSNWSLWSIKKYKQPGFVPLGAEEETSPPSDFVLYQNYPNPFNPNTIISYQLPVTNYVSLKVYDILGREVAVLINEVKQAGEYEVEFNAKNLTSGIYIYQFTAGSFSNSKAMLLIK